jgi:hypothetical protein
MVVITIILAVSVVALPAVLSGLKDRQVGEGARILHAAIYGARDAAGNTGTPHGLRFLPDESVGVNLTAQGKLDPTKALALNRWVQTEIPGEYQIGLASIWPGTDYSTITNLPCLILEEQPGHFEASGAGYVWTLDEPTNWWSVIRLGERVQIRSATFLNTQNFTVCGPVQVQTQEGFIGAAQPWTRVYTAPDGTQQTATAQYLFLVNGLDDNGDGHTDSGWDGVDNNGDGTVDDLAEWEVERWPPNITFGKQGTRYSIKRRPSPSAGQQTTELPSGVVIDLTTWQTTGERSHLPVNIFTGQVDLIFESDGIVRPDTTYGVRSSQGMSSEFLHFWLADRADVVDPSVTQGRFLTLPIPPALAGARQLVQLQARSGRTLTGSLETFADPLNPMPLDPMAPFMPYRK